MSKDISVSPQAAAIKARREIDRVLNQIDKLYPALWQLTNTLQDLGIDLSQSLPEDGGLKSLTDYGRAVIGLGKFLIAIGGGILLLAGGDEKKDE
jgi:hypothetical protein